MKRTSNATPWGHYDANGRPAVSPFTHFAPTAANPSELLATVRLALANGGPNLQAVQQWALANEDRIMSIPVRSLRARAAIRTAFALLRKVPLGPVPTPVSDVPAADPPAVPPAVPRPLAEVAPTAHGPAIGSPAAPPSASAAASQPSRDVMAQEPLQLCQTCGGAGRQHMWFPGNIPESGFGTVVPCATCGGTGYKKIPKHEN
jgi:hypothetical protein